MAGVFSNQVITAAGRNLIASATATNQIVFAKALSASTVPTDPGDTPGYDGVEGSITSSSSTENVARVVASFGNAVGGAPQPAKAIALMGRLASQSDENAVIFAYCADSGSEIYFPANDAPEQITRFAFNIAFDGTAPLEVTEAGAASLSDLERFVSLHRAGDPTTGEDQWIKGSKTFEGETSFFGKVSLGANIVPVQGTTYKIGESVGSRLSDVYTATVHVSKIIGGDTISSNWNIEVGNSIMPELSTVENGVSSVVLGGGNSRFGSVYAKYVNGMSIEVCSASTSVSGKATLTYVDDALVSDKDLVPASTDSGIQTCGRLSRPWKELYVRDAIILARGGNDSALTIYEDDGGIYLDNGYSGAEGGAFFFRSRTGGYSASTVYAGTVVSKGFNGPNLTVSQASISRIPTNEVIAELYNGDVVTIPVGGLILVIPNQTWMINGGAGRSIKPGVSIEITPDDRYAFYIADWTVDSSGSRYIGKSLDIGGTWAFLKTGTYRALCFIDYPANSSNPTSGVPILLQRVA